MKKINSVKKYFAIVCATLLLACVAASNSTAATLTASTVLTVVNVTEFPFNSVDITRWEGDWPSSPTSNLPPRGNPYYEHYLNDVNFTTHSMNWSIVPYPTSYWPFRNGVNSMVAAVWSLDNGKTFKLGSWDYLASTTTGKGTEKGMPNCWMGTLVHTLCDRKVGECNGRFKTNLFFTEWPTGATNCWGTMK